MSKLDVSTDAPLWQPLREQAQGFAHTVMHKTVNLDDLGKRFRAVAEHVREAMESTGQPSLRLRAVCKALDFKTPRSKLEAFVAP